MDETRLPWAVRLTCYAHILLEGSGAIAMLLAPHLVFPETELARGLGGAVFSLVLLAVLALRRPRELIHPTSICLAVFHAISFVLITAQVLPGDARPMQWLSFVIHAVLAVGFWWSARVSAPSMQGDAG